MVDDLWIQVLHPKIAENREREACANKSNGVKRLQPIDNHHSAIINLIEGFSRSNSIKPIATADGIKGRN